MNHTKYQKKCVQVLKSKDFEKPLHFYSVLHKFQFDQTNGCLVKQSVFSLLPITKV